VALSIGKKSMTLDDLEGTLFQNTYVKMLLIIYF